MTAKPPSEDPLAELATAVRSADTARVRSVLERHPKLRLRLDQALPGGSFGETALLAAVHRDDRDTVDALLDAGASINQKSHWWAGGFGVLDHDGPLLDHLLARGAAVDANAAARHGWCERLASLVAADPSVVHARGGDGQTPLHVAATVAIADLLLDHGADIDARDVDHESTPAQYLVRDHPEVARHLVTRGCRTDLLLAVALGDLALARRLLDEDPTRVATRVTDRWFPKANRHSGGTIYNWTLERNASAHRIARSFGHPEVLELLMERSPDELKLCAACELDDEERVRALLAARPDLARSLPADLVRALVDAAQDHNLATVRRMLAAGWPLDARGQHAATALHWAAFHGHVEMVRDLLLAGAALETQDRDYQGTPLGWALHGSVSSWHCRDGDYGGTIKELLAAGAQPPLSPVHQASAVARAALARGSSAARS